MASLNNSAGYVTSIILNFFTETDFFRLSIYLFFLCTTIIWSEGVENTLC
jgi:hypothetical protein